MRVPVGSIDLERSRGAVGDPPDPQLSTNSLRTPFTKLCPVFWFYRQETGTIRGGGAYSQEFGSTEFNIELVLEVCRPFDMQRG